MEKSTFLTFTFLLIFLSACGPNKEQVKEEKETVTETKPEKETDNPWTGTWTFTDGYVDYTMEVSEDYGEKHLCVFTAEGIQTYYVIECIGLVTGDSLQMKNPVVRDGDFRMKDRIKMNEPILTLTRENDGVVFTSWNQLGNNYPDNHSGKVCFKKNPRKPKQAAANFDQIIKDLRKKDSFNQKAAWEKRGLNQSGKAVIAIMNEGKEKFLVGIQKIKDSKSSEEETSVQLNELADKLLEEELDTEEMEFLVEEISPAVEALGFDPVVIFN
ncbi:MAG: DUF5991 domain-containing protein [Fluviicola sp.]